jgi:TRAP-type C4-dicarboxylate transport system substrate-binding protein
VVRKRAPLDTARSALDSAAAPKTLATYITLWHYAIDPLILAVSAKTWAGLSLEDRTTLRKILRVCRNCYTVPPRSGFG